MTTKKTKNLAFRTWFYFRMGWSTYFAFVFAAINTLVVTYYLAIERLPSLKEIFPSFAYYVVFLIAIGLPILVVIGYFHYKKSGAFKAEADIAVEANPHLYRILTNTEAIFPLYLKMSELLIKLSKNEKLSEEETNEITSLQTQLREYMNKKTLDSSGKPNK